VTDKRARQKSRPAAKRGAEGGERSSGVQAELQAKTAEADWLRAHYDAQLRAAFVQIADLQAKLDPAQAGAAWAPADDPVELERLRGELMRLSEAESRYLDRIEELKERLAQAEREEP
jgi:hypothetical protein